MTITDLIMLFAEDMISMERGLAQVDCRHKAMILAYNVLILAAITLTFPLVFVKILTSPKTKKTVLNRLRLESSRMPCWRQSVWVHALSVGEVLAAVPLIRGLRAVCPHRPLALSVSTLTGHAIAKKVLGGDVDSLFFFPYDLWWSVRRAIRRINPAVLFLVESDIWPNFLFEMKRRQIPTILVNGRISPRSFRGYKRVSFFMSSVFSWVSVICAQSKLDADRFKSIGASSEKIKITGNVKFDQEIDPVSDDQFKKTRDSMKIKPGQKVFLAGSTHEGEESVVLEAFFELKKEYHDLVLVIVPRNPGRSADVCRLVAHLGGTAVLLSGSEISSAGSAEVIVVDSMGVLGRLYALADIAFVGGSLVRSGGHNPLEPAGRGKAVLFGYDMSDFASIAEMLIESGGAIQVRDGRGLLLAARQVLGDEDKARRMGANALKVFECNRGAVERTLKASEGLFKE
jgi:3-deoxy-D-manno-octulosonic-acid transferase